MIYVHIVDAHPCDVLSELQEIAPSVIWAHASQDRANIVIYNAPFILPSREQCLIEEDSIRESVENEMLDVFNPSNLYSIVDIKRILLSAPELVQALAEWHKEPEMVREVSNPDNAADVDDYYFQCDEVRRAYDCPVYIHMSLAEICKDIGIPVEDDCMTPPTRPCTPV